MEEVKLKIEDGFECMGVWMDVFNSYNHPFIHSY
jgi:hypothetical protein